MTGEITPSPSLLRSMRQLRWQEQLPSLRRLEMVELTGRKMNYKDKSDQSKLSIEIKAALESKASALDETGQGETALPKLKLWTPTP